MRAIQISGPDHAEMIDVVIPSFAPDEVLVRSRAVSLDASDADLYRGTRPDGFSHYPIIPGHAWAGEVVALGSLVDSITVGDEIVSESLLYCGKCRNCSRKETDLCEKGYNELGFTRSGGLAEYVVAPAQSVHVLPGMAHFDEATLLASCAVVAHAFLHARLLPGDSVAIVGDDTVSLLAVQIAHLFRPASIALIGFREERLALGRTFGATHTINASRDDSQILVRSLSRGRGADLTFEGTAHAQASVEAMLLARRGGTVLLTGTIGSNALLSVESDIFVRNQLNVLGVFGANVASWNYVLHLYRGGLLNLAPLISTNFPLDEYQDALNMLTSRQGQMLRLVVNVE
ncbi:MAG: alcohol dehydrogenase catalytic domain-containing protein [Ktedonobacteraceae bacterium]